MQLLTINCGSSSLKFAWWLAPELERMSWGLVERVGQSGARLLLHGPDEPVEQQVDSPDHESALALVLERLGEGAARGIAAVGHRVVHGGERFRASCPIDDEVIAEIERCSELAPLHNPPNLAGIRACRSLLPAATQVAVFDTAFHQTMPAAAYRYPLPASWYEKYAVRRYGFHGTSHLYVSHRAAVLMDRPVAELRLVTLHIGNGASAAAVSGGRCLDTSMGFTPLEGLVMGTRCGWIDPAVPLWLMKKTGLGPEEMDRILNRQSGLLGLTGRYTDRRDIIAAAAAGDAVCRLALEIECRALRKIIGAYAALLGGLDAVVFTAGVGENSPEIRAAALQGLEFLGLYLDAERNQAARGREALISSSASRVQAWVIPTDEERVIAEDTLAIAQGRFGSADFRYSFAR